MKIILWLILITLVVLVIARKIKRIKMGKFCDCGCSDCPSKCREFNENPPL